MKLYRQLKRRLYFVAKFNIIDFHAKFNVIPYYDIINYVLQI